MYICSPNMYITLITVVYEKFQKFLKIRKN